MRLDDGQIEVMDEIMVPFMRAKSGAQRQAMADDMYRFAWQIIAASARRTHPEWDEQQIAAHTAKRLAGGAA